MRGLLADGVHGVLYLILIGTYCCVASEALRFGYGWAAHVGVDVGAADVEVDVIYISFIMNAQHTGYLVPYKDQVQLGKCTTGQLKLCVDY